MIKKFLAAGIIASVLVIGLSLTAEAHPDNQEKAVKLAEKIKNFDLDDADLPDVEKTGPQPNPSLFIGPNGKVRIISGTVTAVAENAGPVPANFVVEVWKIKLTVDTSAAKIIPEKGTSTLAIAIGHQVSVRGAMDANTGLVKANVIRNHSLSESKADIIQKKIAELFKKLNELRARINLPPINP